MQVVGVIYFATVPLFPEAFRAVARQQFVLAIVASTLAIAALGSLWLRRTIAGSSPGSRPTVEETS